MDVRYLIGSVESLHEFSYPFFFLFACAHVSCSMCLTLLNRPLCIQGRRICAHSHGVLEISLPPSSYLLHQQRPAILLSLLRGR